MIADHAALVSRLLDIQELANQRNVRLDIHLTHGVDPELESVDGEKDNEEKEGSMVSYTHDRPELSAVIGSAFNNMTGSLFIAGPSRPARSDEADDMQRVDPKGSFGTSATPTPPARCASRAARRR